jgi:DNA-binding transcriptional LysR family regulator
VIATIRPARRVRTSRPSPTNTRRSSCQLVEPRWVALPSGHRLAEREQVDFGELLDEPLVALPAEAGPMRDFWLATAERGGRPARVAVEVTTADETFEAVASGLGVHLLAAGNAASYARPGIICRSVGGLSPCSLVVAWRRGDQRDEVRVFVQASLEAARSTASQAALRSA